MFWVNVKAHVILKAIGLLIDVGWRYLIRANPKRCKPYKKSQGCPKFRNTLPQLLRNTSRLVVFATAHKGGRRKELVECEARQLSMLLPEHPWDTSRPVVMTTTHQDVQGSALSLGTLVSSRRLFNIWTRTVALGLLSPSQLVKVVVVLGETTLSWWFSINWFQSFIYWGWY